MEQWKNVEGFEGIYEVSSIGRLKSLPKKCWFINRKEKIISLFINKWWYKTSTLCNNYITNSIKIHRLVAQHFIPNPLNLPLVCHKDETLDENWALYNWFDNLFWGTHSDNAKDMYKKWREKNHWMKNPPNPNKWKFWKYHHCSKQINQYTLDWELIKTWDSIRDIERQLWIHWSNISMCCSWKIKTAKWYIWKFK